MTWQRTIGTLIVIALLAGCAGTAEKKSLYDRLGGKPAIQAVVDDFIAGGMKGDIVNQ